MRFPRPRRGTVSLLAPTPRKRPAPPDNRISSRIFSRNAFSRILIFRIVQFWGLRILGGGGGCSCVDRPAWLRSYFLLGDEFEQVARDGAACSKLVWQAFPPSMPQGRRTIRGSTADERRSDRHTLSSKGGPGENKGWMAEPIRKGGLRAFPVSSAPGVFPVKEELPHKRQIRPPRFGVVGAETASFAQRRVRAPAAVAPPPP
jgi:hypothetical protein